MTETAEALYTGIQKGIPLPERARLAGRRPQFQYAEDLDAMTVGEDSFAVFASAEEGYEKIAGRISSMIQRKQRVGTKRWTWRRVVEEGREGVRVWRTK